MKTLKDFINEQLNASVETTVEKTSVEVTESNEINENINSEEDFRAAAKAEFEKAFGDDLDEDKMNATIDGILNDNKEDVEAGNWGKLIGILNKSF